MYLLGWWSRGLAAFGYEYYWRKWRRQEAFAGVTYIYLSQAAVDVWTHGRVVQMFGLMQRGRFNVA